MGLILKKADKIYDDMFAIMEKANVVDVRSPEEHNKWVDKQMEMLGA